MGRYENTLRYIQLKNFMQEKKYEDALELADQMEETKIKDVCELKLLADVYRKNGEYLKAKDLYRVIYGEIKTRRVLYYFIVLCIKAKSFTEAESYYEEYLIRDKKSVDRYILRYRLDRAKNANREIIIKDLENIRDEQYMEEWAYELAKQYHKAGMVEACIQECDNIVLWFSDGEISEKAKMLKMHYENNVGQDFVSSVQEDLGCDISKYMEDKESDNFCTVSQACEKIEEDKNLLPHFLVVARDESFVLPIIRKIIKKIQGQEPENTKRIAKINAVNLNSIQIEDQVEELKGACVMIEEASLLEKKTCERLIQIIKREDNTILFAFISGDGEINEHLKDHLHYYIQC